MLVLNSVTTFLSSTLSSFYFDAVKETLYCEAAENPKRLAIVAVLQQVSLLYLGTSLILGITYHPKDHRAYRSTSSRGTARACGREGFGLLGHLGAECMSSCLRKPAADPTERQTGYGLGRGHEGHP